VRSVSSVGAPRPAVFLDRDGTIIKDVGFLTDVSEMTLLPGSGEAIRTLNAAGYPVVVITNQSGVGRGLFDERHVDAVHDALRAAIASDGGRIEAFYYCPHHPTKSTDELYRVVCACRKPAPGLLRQAAADLDLDLSRSWMVGDWWRDVEAGVAAGTHTILLRSGHEGLHGKAPVPPVQPDAILNNLMEAAGWILRTSPR
jgi:D-glycero-D-manno-heptose 1,7-bisphosphate phosphatase